MKAVVFGGAGIEGSYAVNYLTRHNKIHEIIIADIDTRRGKMIGDKYEKTRFLKTDVTDQQSLNAAFNDADIVVNCVGPFYKFALPILSTSIQKGIPYVDICDDYDMTEELLDSFDKDAKDAGTTCIVGLGASPGLTNIMAKFASEQLTTTKDITVCVTRGLTEEAGGAIPYHMFHCWLGPVPVYKNGQFTKGMGLTDGCEPIIFPEPFGAGKVYYFGHPETITLPRYIEGLENACCKGTFFPDTFRQLLLQIYNLGLTSNQPIPVGNIQVAPIDFLASYLKFIGKQIILSNEKIPEGGAVIVKVIGEKDGVERIIQYSGCANMKEGTATPAAIGAEMILEEKIMQPGVTAPEGCIPSKEFINRIIGQPGFGKTWITIRDEINGPIP
jgi:saccharopine dehydrogenase (NAD+, L-lysine-forming)